MRKDKLLRKLAARTDSQGKPKPGYEQNVADIRAELAVINDIVMEAMRGSTDAR